MAASLLQFGICMFFMTECRIGKYVTGVKRKWQR